jgi:hypothetical protein
MASGAAIVAGAVVYAHRVEAFSERERRALEQRPSPAGYDPLEPASGGPPDSPAGLREVRIAPPAEYDFLRREEIVGRRVARVESEPALFAAFGGRRYHPSSDVFRRLESGKPWWGLVGLAFQGNGTRSIDGDTGESRFVENPYLLVGAHEVWANIVPDKTNAHPVYPRPQLLAFDAAGRRGFVRYDVTSFYREGERFGYREPRDRSLSLTGYNAADLGLPFFYFDAGESKNVRFKIADVFVERQVLGVGPSCGYPGGCNNQIALAPEMDIAIDGLPARVVVRLWRTRPDSPAAQPDVWFVLELV